MDLLKNHISQRNDKTLVIKFLEEQLSIFKKQRDEIAEVFEKAFFEELESLVTPNLETYFSQTVPQFPSLSNSYYGKHKHEDNPGKVNLKELFVDTLKHGIDFGYVWITMPGKNFPQKDFILVLKKMSIGIKRLNAKKHGLMVFNGHIENLKDDKNKYVLYQLRLDLEK